MCCDVQVDDLDYAMRKKDATKANAAYAQVNPGYFVCLLLDCFFAHERLLSVSQLSSLSYQVGVRVS